MAGNVGLGVSGTGTFSGTNNLIQDGNVPTGLANTVIADPLLGPLQDNGGPTLTHALLAGSAAIDTGEDSVAVDAMSNPLTTDQRGQARFVGTVDIGAYERFMTAMIEDLTQETLQDMINAVAEGGTIMFDETLANGTVTLDGGSLLINKALTLDGGTNNITLDADGNGRVITIDNEDDNDQVLVVISGLTITGGLDDIGGGILNQETLVLSNSMVMGNSAQIDGGGIFNTGMLMIQAGAMVSGNTANNDGGGIFNAGGTIEITGATISNNVSIANADGNGGGGILNDGTLTITNSVIANNTAGMDLISGAFGSLSLASNHIVTGLAKGGGIMGKVNAKTTVINSTVSENQSSAGGGGVDHSGQTMDFLNVSIINNSAGASGGGLLLSGTGTFTITGGQIRNNTASQSGGGLWIATGTRLMIGTNGVGGTLIDGNLANGNDASQGGGGIFNQGGILNGTGVTLSNNIATASASGNGGGGLFNNGGAVTLTNSIVTGNRANNGMADGGGILNSGGLLTLNGGSIAQNTAARAGGGIADNSGSGQSVFLGNVTMNNNRSLGSGGGLHITGQGQANITGGTVSGNSAALQGGGIWTDLGILTIDRVTIDGNTASGTGANDGGGAIYTNAGGGTLNISRSTLSNNIASGHGGGLFNALGGTLNLETSTLTGNQSSGDGGGIWNAAALNLTNVTLSGNTAAVRGGGIHTLSGPAAINNSTIANNTAGMGGGGIHHIAGSVILNSTIVALNLSNGTNSDVSGTAGGTFNLIGVNTGLLGLTNGVDNNQVGTAVSPINPLLGPLANNGGPIRTHDLLTGSPAINAGDNPLSLENDQRGGLFLRTFEGQTDIGALELQPNPEIGNDIIVTAPGPGAALEVVVRRAVTNEVLFRLDPYPGTLGGIRVATGDVTGDGIPDIITGAGPGGGPHIKVFDGKDGAEIMSFFAFDPNFLSGVFVAAADLDGDDQADIIVGADAGGGPHVRVFSGRDGSELFSFFAYASSFSGGVRVAAGDITGDGVADIITAAGPGGGPHIKVFDGTDGSEAMGFFAYSSSFFGGVSIAAGKVNDDGRIDIITGAGPGGSPHVRVFDGATQQQLPGAIGSFFAYSPSFLGGVNVSASDVNNDGQADVITGAGPGGGPHVLVFSGAGGAALEVLDSGFAFGGGFTGGVFVAGSTSQESNPTSGLVNSIGNSNVLEFLAITAPSANGRLSASDLNATNSEPLGRGHLLARDLHELRHSSDNRDVEDILKSDYFLAETLPPVLGRAFRARRN